MPWQFYKLGLIVTGKGEAEFLPRLFRSLQTAGTCSFEVVRKIGQRSEIAGPKRRIEMVGKGKKIPTRDEYEIGVPARQWLNGGGAYVVLVDDLEQARAVHKKEVFQRYRLALDAMLGERRHLASVHFLVNMLEAYYFAHAAAINAVLSTNLSDHADNVEEIRHPKNELKSLAPGFDEVRDGKEILSQLDLEHVLARPETCASLRVLIAWCSLAMGMPGSSRYQLDGGVYDIVTGPQLRDLMTSTLDALPGADSATMAP
jgi:hypothetical protein